VEKSESLRDELDRTLHGALQGRSHTYAHIIRHLVLTNFERGRLRYFTNHNAEVAVADYVDLVMAGYDSWHEYVGRVQVDRAVDVWEPLFEQLQKWAYNLIRSRLQSNPHSERLEHAVACAADAGAAIVNSHFPYDTAFEAWTYVLLSYTVNKYVRQLPGFSSNTQPGMVQLDMWPDWLSNLVDPAAERELHQYELHEILVQAIAELPAGQQEVITLLFHEKAYSYKEIATLTGRSLCALHKAKFVALEGLRKILHQTVEAYW
jgi:RNA polymerase sigma factor (sigma-70 family)